MPDRTGSDYLPPERSLGRLGVISPCYDPETGSAAVAGAICRALAGLGYEVHVLTGFPNYPTGAIYPGYRMKPYLYEHRDGIHLHRVPLLPSHDRSATRRALTYLSFAASASTKWSVLRSVDAWLVISSQATVALPALFARAFFRRPFVLYIQDLWPETVVESGFIRPGRVLDLVARSIQAFCNFSYRRASAIAVSAPGMASRLQQRGVASAKVTPVPNWVDEQVFSPVTRDEDLAAEFGLDGFVIMYAGSLGDLQGLDTAVKAFKMLPDLPDLRLVFVGSGVAEERLRALAEGDDRVRFLGPHPVERTVRLMALSDVQLVSLQDRPLFRHTIPSKIQAAMACARPIIASAPGDAAHAVLRSRAGLVARPGDPCELSSAMRLLHGFGPQIREAMGRNGREFYMERMSARVGSATLSDLVALACGGDGG
ncbi:glycosyltransferase family 4 protein [Glycomyces sp. NRRL B-16210]|uniref:glycosyltransferase family 4 protein n=1 Tax=Glycomyces sp. NRRL B-16210 TaxID=1463821 RepID=UPI00068E08EF|nr:glycosyltransferase family 4 protein [Glycomyces sp. NRRL B-16210]